MTSPDKFAPAGIRQVIGYVCHMVNIGSTPGELYRTRQGYGPEGFPGDRERCQRSRSPTPRPRGQQSSSLGHDLPAVDQRTPGPPATAGGEAE